MLKIGVKIKLLVRSIPDKGIINTEVEYIVGDLLDINLNIENMVEDCDVIINSSGEITNKKLMYDLHVISVKKIINTFKKKALVKKNAVHWVQLSSVGVYGASESPSDMRAVTEETKRSPQGEYEITKCLADEYIEKQAEQNIFTFTILRPSNIFGPDMPNNSLRQLSKMIRKGLFFYIGKIEAISTYIHVTDVSAALVECTINENSKNQIFNLSCDCPQFELIDGIANSLKVKKPNLRIPYFIAKIMCQTLGRFKFFPLSINRLNALISNTKYPTSKIDCYLNLPCKKYPPLYINEVIK